MWFLLKMTESLAEVDLGPPNAQRYYLTCVSMAVLRKLLMQEFCQEEAGGENLRGVLALAQRLDLGGVGRDWAQLFTLVG